MLLPSLCSKIFVSLSAVLSKIFLSLSAVLSNIFQSSSAVLSKIFKSLSAVLSIKDTDTIFSIFIKNFDNISNIGIKNVDNHILVVKSLTRSLTYLFESFLVSQIHCSHTAHTVPYYIVTIIHANIHASGIKLASIKACFSIDC